MADEQSGWSDNELTEDGEASDGGTTEPSGAYGVPVTSSRGQEVLHPGRDEYLDLMWRLRDDHGFGMCVDVTAVDYLVYDAPRHLPDGVPPQRFEVVASLLSHYHRRRVRVRVQVPEDDATIPSLFEVYPGSEALEREAFDMFGVRFDGHPDLTRILMPEEWDGYPLRKSHPVGSIPVQFKGVVNAR